MAKKYFTRLHKNSVQFKTFKVELIRVYYGLDLECGENISVKGECKNFNILKAYISLA